MINYRQQIIPNPDVPKEYILQATYDTNYEDDDYFGESKHKVEDLFTGSLAECNAYIELQKKRVNLKIQQQ